MDNLTRYTADDEVPNCDDVNTSMILMNGVCKIAAEQMAGAAI